MTRLHRYYSVESAALRLTSSRTSAPNQLVAADCAYQPLRLDVPTLVIADYKVLKRSAIEVLYLRGHDVAATIFADAAEKIVPFITDWFGPIRREGKNRRPSRSQGRSFRERRAFAHAPCRRRPQTRRTGRRPSTHARRVRVVPSVDRRRPRPLRAGSLPRTRERTAGRARLHGTAPVCAQRN